MTSRTPITTLRLPDDVREDLEQYVADTGLTLNAAGAKLLRLGLNAEDRAFIERHGGAIRAEVDKMLTARGLANAAP